MEVKARDIAGNESVASATQNFVVEVTVPEIEASVADLTIPSTLFTKDGDTVEVRAVFDADRIDTSTLRADLSAFGGREWSIPREVGDGEAAWRVRGAVCSSRNGELVTTVTAADRFGRWTTGTATITADNIIPWLVLTPQWPDPTNTNTVTLTGEAYDEAPGRVASVEYRLNGG